MKTQNGIGSGGSTTFNFSPTRLVWLEITLLIFDNLRIKLNEKLYIERKRKSNTIQH